MCTQNPLGTIIGKILESCSTASNTLIWVQSLLQSAWLTRTFSISFGIYVLILIFSHGYLSGYNNVIIRSITWCLFFALDLCFWSIDNRLVGLNAFPFLIMCYLLWDWLRKMNVKKESGLVEQFSLLNLFNY